MSNNKERRSISDKLLDGDSDDETERLETPIDLPPKLKKGTSYENVKKLNKGTSYENINSTNVQTKKIGQRIAKIKTGDDTHTNIYNLTELHEMGDNAVTAFEEIDMDVMLEYVGHEGKYQYRLIALASILSITMSMIMYASSYLLATPKFYHWKNDKWIEYTGGNAEEKFCGLAGKYDTWIDYTKIKDGNPDGHLYSVDWLYHGYTKEYGIVCEREGIREVYLMVTELVPALIGLVASILSDTFGRTRTFVVASIFCLTGALVGAIVNVEIVKIISLAVFIGEEAVLCTQITYILNESMTTKSTLRSKSVAIYFAIFALGGICISLMSYVFTHWYTQYWVVTGLSIVSFLPVPFCIVEPPKQLYKRGIVGNLFRTLLRISKLNGKDHDMEDLQMKCNFERFDFTTDKLKFETQTTFKEKMIQAGMNFKMIFCSKLCIRMIAYGLVGASVYIIFFAVTYNSGKIGLPSVQLNVILLAAVEVVVYIACMFFVAKLRRRCGGFVNFSVVLFGTILCVVFFAVLHEDEKFRDLIIAILTCVFIKGGLSVEYVLVYTYGSELFPSTVRGTAVGLALTTAKVLGLLSGKLIKLAESLGTAAMVGPSASAIIAMLAQIVQPETLNQKID